jgi:hypothetical protein
MVRRNGLVCSLPALLLGFSLFDHQIPRAPPPAFHLAKHAALQQIGDVAQGGVCGAFGQGCPFFVGECCWVGLGLCVAWRLVQDVIEHEGLPRVEGRAGPALPKLGFAEHACEQAVCALHGAQQAG